MMKLFYAPGACSLAAHIMLEETATAYEAIHVDLAGGEQRKPEFLALNPNGQVPFLLTAKGAIAEVPAIVMYLADTAPEYGLRPSDPYSRAVAVSFLAWCSGMVHGRTFAAMFRPAAFATEDSAHAAIKEKAKADLPLHLAVIDARVRDREWVMDRFGVADLYPFVFRRWAARVGQDMSAFPSMLAHADRIAARPAVARVLAAEGIRIDA